MRLPLETATPVLACEMSPLAEEFPVLRPRGKDIVGKAKGEPDERIGEEAKKNAHWQSTTP
jgi:hypothetical protein